MYLDPLSRFAERFNGFASKSVISGLFFRICDTVAFPQTYCNIPNSLVQVPAGRRGNFPHIKNDNESLRFHAFQQTESYLPTASLECALPLFTSDVIIFTVCSSSGEWEAVMCACVMFVCVDGASKAANESANWPCPGAAGWTDQTGLRESRLLFASPSKHNAG